MAAQSSKQHFVLVHGAGHGAWCWYRIVDLLEQAGHRASAVDLASAGTDSTDPDTVTGVHQMAAPLISFFQALPESEKVILVVHSLGGLIGTAVMELFPRKIAVAVFLAAMMFPDSGDQKHGPRLKRFFAEAFKGFQGALDYNFANGADQLPTSVRFDPHSQQVADAFYNLSPSKDRALARMCLKRLPLWSEGEYFAPRTAQGYGSVQRVFIGCEQDNVITPEWVDAMCQALPPTHRVSIYADHSPFFSAPKLLHTVLLEIAAAQTNSSFTRTLFV